MKVTGTTEAADDLYRIELEQARLLTLKAAHMMDTVGNKVGRGKEEIDWCSENTSGGGQRDRHDQGGGAQHVPEGGGPGDTGAHLSQLPVSYLVQAHGAAGLHSDLPLAGFYGWARALRLVASVLRLDPFTEHTPFNGNESKISHSPHPEDTMVKGMR